MSSDRGLESTRAVRAEISREHGNDPRTLLEYYLEYQKRFADRLRPAQEERRVVEQRHAADGAARRS